MATDLGQAILRRPKKLICALDGTWMDSDSGWEKGSFGSPGHLQVPSNVTRIARAIKPEDSSHCPQIIYYQAGVGTGVGLRNQILGGGTGLGLSEHIREAYSFLANNYAPGDSIHLIGFSRGAFTARSLGGLLGQLGLLTRKGLPFFYEIFLDWENAGNPASQGSLFWKHYRDEVDPDKEFTLKTPSDDSEQVVAYLREYRALLRSLGLIHVVPNRENTYQDVLIQTIGVWDTVGALGIPVNPWLQKVFGLPSFVHEYKWMDTALGDNVINAFQALALDEHRAPFSPAVWERPRGCRTRLKQVWFPGAHSNVGGSYDDTASADISLAWMMDQLSGESLKSEDEAAFDPKDWIEFYEDYLDTQQNLNVAWYKDHPPARDYSKGTLYDSFTFPQSLAGHIVRTPGRYRVMDPLTGKTKNGVLMRDTQEFMHASVRTRIDLGGTGSVPKPSRWNVLTVLIQWLHALTGREAKKLYKPAALHEWKLHDGHKYHNDFAINNVRLTVSREDDAVRPPWWEWEGKDRHVAQGLVINEDIMARFELQLLRRFEDVAAEIEASNKGLSSVEELKRVLEKVARRSVTV